MATVPHSTHRVAVRTRTSEKLSLADSIKQGCHDPILAKVERRERVKMSLYFIVPMITIAGAMVLSQL